MKPKIELETASAREGYAWRGNDPTKGIAPVITAYVKTPEKGEPGNVTCALKINPALRRFDIVSQYLIVKMIAQSVGGMLEKIEPKAIEQLKKELGGE